ncbi:hypothetical protein CHS0354_014273, partial [Potamilus streckersoni]
KPNNESPILEKSPGEITSYKVASLVDVYGETSEREDASLVSGPIQGMPYVFTNPYTATHIEKQESGLFKIIEKIEGQLSKLDGNSVQNYL